MKAKEKLLIWMKDYAPPGIHLSKEISYWFLILGVCTGWCGIFPFRYVENLNSLYEIRAGKRYLMENSFMPSFDFLTNGLFEVFSIAIAFSIFMIVYHYYYHNQGSKMMYLMRRLPNKWEVHIRCIILPVVGAVISIIYMFVLRMLFYTIYILCTPPQCLIL
ncbi:MAG: hypothetical protein IJ958_11210 [Agathobacter sp.]|nr:hypothetical protein [Agathobacter sp.]